MNKKTADLPKLCAWIGEHKAPIESFQRWCRGVSDAASSIFLTTFATSYVLDRKFLDQDEVLSRTIFLTDRRYSQHLSACSGVNPTFSE